MSTTRRPQTSALLLLLMAMTAACGDDTAKTPTGPRPGADQGSVDSGGEDMRPDMRPGPKLDDGDACAQSAQCASGACAGGRCRPTQDAGPACGELHCQAAQECLQGACQDACDAQGPRCQTASGPICCGPQQACLFESCVTLGQACDDASPCPRAQFCEPTQGRCIPRSADPNACVYIPPAESFNPVQAWAWTGSADSPEYDQVMMTPMVANLTDDNGDGLINEQDTPDIAFVTFRGNAYTQDGVLRLISGDGAKEHWSSSTLPVPFMVHGSTSPALADLDDDGRPEIIISAAPSAGGGLMVIEHTGQIRWHRADLPTLVYGSVSVANIDGQGSPEIVTFQHVLTADGQTLCALPTGSHVPAIADLDEDGTQEIIHGSAIYRLIDPSARDGSGCEVASVMGGQGGGFNAVANLDDDPAPEIVHTLGGSLRVHKRSGELVWERRLPLDMTRIAQIYNITDCSPPAQIGQACAATSECGHAGQCSNRVCRHHPACSPGGGPPTIADFDGDGTPEIGVAARWYYLVYRADGSILWAHSTKDFSSAVTGSSVFDFEGDGRAEVVYNDEEFLRVYRGAGKGVDEDGDGFPDPVILFETPNTSGTLYEYPLIVDVDNDGNAEIVVMANDYSSSTNPNRTKGIRVLRDDDDNWVSTRRIWNQHTYHVTHVHEDATIPRREPANWTVPGLNNYRQNVQGDGLFNAPNLVVSALEVNSAGCGSNGRVPIRVTIKNAGSLGVRAGSVLTSVWAGQPPALIATLPHTVDLPPGAQETLSLEWPLPERLLGKPFTITARVDDDGQGQGRHNECREDDNVRSLDDVLCAAPQ